MSLNNIHDMQDWALKPLDYVYLYDTWTKRWVGNIQSSIIDAKHSPRIHSSSAFYPIQMVDDPHHAQPLKLTVSDASNLPLDIHDIFQFQMSVRIPSGDVYVLHVMPSSTYHSPVHVYWVPEHTLVKSEWVISNDSPSTIIDEKSGKSMPDAVYVGIPYSIWHKDSQLLLGVDTNIQTGEKYPNLVVNKQEITQYAASEHAHNKHRWIFIPYKDVYIHQTSHNGCEIRTAAQLAGSDFQCKKNPNTNKVDCYVLRPWRHQVYHSKKICKQFNPQSGYKCTGAPMWRCELTTGNDVEYDTYDQCLKSCQSPEAKQRLLIRQQQEKDFIRMKNKNSNLKTSIQNKNNVQNLWWWTTVGILCIIIITLIVIKSR